jgi:hypothetical protein
MGPIEITWIREYVRERDTSEASNKNDSTSKKKFDSTIEYLSASAHLLESEESFKNLR